MDGWKERRKKETKSRERDSSYIRMLMNKFISGRMEFENQHFATIIVITDSDKNAQ